MERAFSDPPRRLIRFGSEYANLLRKKMALGWIFIGGFVVLVLLLLARDEYYDRQEKKRRLDLRAEIEWPVLLRANCGEFQGRTINISASGALIWCPVQVSRGEVVTLAIKSPIRGPLAVTAEVVRTDVQCKDEEEIARGLAVRFIIISQKDREFITFSVFDHLQ